MQLKYVKLNWQHDILAKFYFDKLVRNTDTSLFGRFPVQINDITFTSLEFDFYPP